MPSFASDKGSHGDSKLPVGKSKDENISELGRIFNTALEKYLKSTKRELQDLTHVDDFHDAIVGTEQMASHFDKTRHPETKLNAVLTTVEPCMDWVSYGFQFVADHASGSFASPAKAIAGAAVYAIKAAQNVTQDLDDMVECFARIKETMSNISILRDFVPEHDHFHHRLMLVFTKMLDFCGFAEKLFIKHSKVYMYFKTLVSGRNQSIFDKCDSVKHAIDSFRETIPFSALALQGEIKSKVEDVPQKTLEKFMTAIKEKKMDPREFSEDNGKAELTIRKYFSLPSQELSIGQPEPTRPEDLVGKFDAVFELGTFRKWYDGNDTSFLWVSGPSGSGKSFFIFSTKYRLEISKSEERSIIVAQYCFAPGTKETQELRYAVQDVVLQIARKDKKYADQIVREFEKKEKPGPSTLELRDLWRQVIQDKFPRTSEPSTRTLFILFDGVDQMEDESKNALLDLFSRLSPDRSAIYVMFTSEQSFGERLNGEKGVRSVTARYPNIELQKHTKTDVERFADSKYQSSNVLRRIPNTTWEKYKQKILAKAQGIFAYIDVVLARMERLGDDPASLNKFIDQLEAGTEGLYSQISEMLVKSRNINEGGSLSTLYNWIVFGVREFSLKELGLLLGLDKDYGGTAFDIEKEIKEDRSSSVLYLRKLPGPTTQILSGGDLSDDKARELRDTFVVFRQPLFREFLKSITRQNGLISDPNATKVNIFTLLSDIICGSPGISTEARAGLQSYAVSSVLSHFIAIDIAAASKLQAANVVQALHKLFTNTNGASQKIEEVTKELSFWDPKFDLYTKFNQTQGNGRTVQQTIVSWANKIRYHGAEDLTEDAKEWVRRVVLEDGSQALVPLIKGHVDSWLMKVTEESALPPFQLASQAVRESKLVSESDARCLSGSDDFPFSEQSINALSKALKAAGVTLEYSARGRIAMALLVYSARSESNMNVDYARDLYLQNIQDAVSGANRFYTLVGLAEYYGYKASLAEDQKKEREQHEAETETGSENVKKMYSQAARYSELALKQHELEKKPLGSDLEPTRLRKSYWMRANALERVGDTQTAISTLDTAIRELHPTTDLDDLVNIILDFLSQQEDYLGIIRRVQLWPLEVRNQWLSTWDTSTFRKAVVKTNRADFLIRCYEEAIDSLKEAFYAGIYLRWELAQIYRKEYRQTAMSRSILKELRQTLDEIRRTQPSLRNYSSDFWLTIQKDLLQLLCEDFNTTHHEKRQKEILEETSQLYRDVANSMSQAKSFKDADFDIAIARMCCRLGLVVDTRKYITRAFDACIEDLTDTIAGNDQEAFTNLGRVLCFADLKAHAQIAFSMRLSLVDESYEDKPQPVQSDSPVTEQVATSSRDTVRQDEEAEDIHHIESELSSENSLGSSLTAKPSVKEQTAPTPPVGNGVPNLADDKEDLIKTNGPTTPSNVRISDGIDMGEKIENGKSPEPESTIKEKDGDSSNEPSTSPPKKQKTEEYDSFGWIYCNGCQDGPRFKSWFGTRPGSDSRIFTPPNYVCLACPDVDLCHSCYDIQSAFQNGTGMGFWRVVCPGSAPHQYVKQPIEGWLGVKNGVIHMKSDGDGTQHRTKAYKEWLADVRNRFATVNWQRVVASHNKTEETKGYIAA